MKENKEMRIIKKKKDNEKKTVNIVNEEKKENREKKWIYSDRIGKITNINNIRQKMENKNKIQQKEIFSDKDLGRG
jgi:hypothetical protein